MYIDPQSPVRSGFKKASPRVEVVNAAATLPQPQPIQRRQRPQGKSIVQTLLWLAPVVTFLPYFLAKLHYSLPEPRTET
jgi:hypothetical protein